jgi:hypothetical protein
MSTKEELAQSLNQILGIDIDWSKLKKEDLEKLHSLLSDPMALINMAGKIGREKLRSVIDRPLRDFIERPIVEEISDKIGSRQGGGLFGFGVLPFNPLFRRGQKEGQGSEREKEKSD